MTDTKINPKWQKANESGINFDVLSSPPQAPTFTWCDGHPFLPDDDPDKFFDLVDAESSYDIDQGGADAQNTDPWVYESFGQGTNASTDGGRPPLGNIVNMQANSANEELTTRQAVKLITKEEVRLRWKMMAYIKGCLRSILPWTSSVLNCSTAPIGDVVKISQTVTSMGNPSAKFSNMVHDHNTWICPLCSFKIAVGRVNELREIVYKAKKQGMECYHMTVTMAHQEWDRLDYMLQDMRNALYKFWGQRMVKDWFKSCFVHRVSTVEITKGFDALSNGWHPHVHILLIGYKGVPVEVLQSDYSAEWLKALRSVGRDGKDGIALKVEPVTNIENYLVKVPCEIGLSNITKHGHGAHMTFFQMVAYAVNSGSSEVQAEIAQYVREYYQATKGMHQMQKSKGLNEYFKVKEKTDEELASQDTEKVMRDLLWVKGREMRRCLNHDDYANIFLMARAGDVASIIDYLHKHGVFTIWHSEEESIQDLNTFIE